MRHLLCGRRLHHAKCPKGNYPRSLSGVMVEFLEVVKPRQGLELFKNNPNSVFNNSCNKCHKDWSGDEAGYLKGVEAYPNLPNIN